MLLRFLFLGLGVLTTLYIITHQNRYLLDPTTVLEGFQILISNSLVVKLFIGIPYITALCCVLGLLALNKGIDNLVFKEQLMFQDNKEIVDLAKQKFEYAKNSIKLILYVLSGIIVFSIFTTGYLRKSVLSLFNSTDDFFFPIEFVYVYGLVFTLFLAIIYVPIYTHLKLKGERLLKTLVFNQEITQDITEIEEVFYLKTTTYGSLKIIITILSPILSSIIPQIFE